jgi:hypothetical protein
MDSYGLAASCEVGNALDENDVMYNLFFLEYIKGTGSRDEKSVDVVSIGSFELNIYIYIVLDTTSRTSEDECKW